MPSEKFPLPLFFFFLSFKGDSGGPLVLNEGGIMQEVGVVSTGYGCGEARFPSIYTRVDKYTQWITNELFSGCT